MTLRSITAVVTLLSLGGCTAALKLAKDDSADVLSQQTITAPNPAETGSYAVKQLTYGSGTDKHRPEYGTNVNLQIVRALDSAVASMSTQGKSAAEQNLQFSRQRQANI